MHKFFVSNDNIYEATAVISGDDVKHIYRVLRLEPEDEVIINNCKGKEYLGVILSIDKKEVRVKLIQETGVNNESPVEISLFQGLPKSSKMDLIVQKASELGLKDITPIITKRVAVQGDFVEFNKTDRWQRIALEACKQCKRTMIPVINKPIEINNIIKRISDFDLVVVPYENENNFGIKQLVSRIDFDIRSIAVIIGPEGGFEEDEIQSLVEGGAQVVTLGPRILRTETAGFVCASILQYEFGDLGGKGISTET
jgi:16S rRNA (uracil1498-N3)-methyltransferase